MNPINKKLTVTIGIPAYNEEKNIGKLIQNIKSQKKQSYVIDKIFIVSDGSTDNTVLEASKFEGITVVSDGKRMGKSERLNQIYQMNNSEILITLDADIHLQNESVFEELLKKFSDPQVVVVGGNGRPLPGRTFLEKVIVAKDEWWYEARKDFNHGNNIYNSAGCCFALKKDFVRSFIFLPGTLHDEEIIYLQTIQQEKKFAFAERAIFRYREAATWKELIIRARRYEHRDNIAAYGFTFDVKKVTQLPLYRKLKGIAKVFRLMPFYVFYSLVLTFMLKILLIKKRDNNIHNLGLWNITESTKRLY